MSPNGDTRQLGQVWGGLFGTCHMFWFLEVEDVMGITTKFTTQRARDWQEKLAHPPHPMWQQLRAD